ncbi:DUF6346 domain-containing protein [Couchioplanes azureus]|uniref:DUF6346 domain-containing protein n=1 Tax=Couchioplanes caeruleus TaxID=56438 RepID=UPI00166F99D0|nr:DUF6346 domain-containing protein [Couchioplanes caeruleus]GGQ87396.1 hypothetical protein GCM10010166_67030 [Couchioplanes caeruleus subsp. azureus]
MDSWRERAAERLAEIREQERELDEIRERERELDRKTADPEAGTAVGFVRSFLAIAAILVLGFGLLGLAVTLNRLAGEDMADAKREGEATVSYCVTHGPITTRGFGSWASCEAQMTWADGQVERATVGDVFTSADIGATVRVGDLGSHRGSRLLARADQTPKPWLAWLSYGVGVVAMVPTFVGVLLLRELLRFRKR